MKLMINNQISKDFFMRECDCYICKEKYVFEYKNMFYKTPVFINLAEKISNSYFICYRKSFGINSYFLINVEKFEFIDLLKELKENYYDDIEIEKINFEKYFLELDYEIKRRNSDFEKDISFLKRNKKININYKE